MRGKRFNLLCLALSLMFALSVVLAGCGSSNKSNNEPAASNEPAATSDATDAPASSEPAASDAPADGSKLDPVELTWYFGGAPQADVASVETEMNKILKEKLNVTLHLKAIDWGNFDQKMQVINASGDNYDLAFTSNWTNSYYQNVNKGVFIPLDDLLKQYAPTIMATIPQGGWDAAKVNGKQYAVPNYQIWASTDAVLLQKELVDKYGFDTSTVKSPEDLETFLDNVKKNEPDLIPLENIKTGLWGVLLNHYGFDEMAGRNIPGSIRLEGTDLKVVNQFETNEYKSFVHLMRDWNQKGYFRKDAATLADSSADRAAGKYAVSVAGTAKPGGDVEFKAATGKDELQVVISNSYLKTSGIIATMTGVSANSKNPERAVMLLDLLFKDKQLYNLLAHGIENKHYTITGDNTVKAIADSGYDPNTDWEFGSQFNGFYREGQPAGIWEETIKWNEQAKPSPAIGFSFDPTPVKSEIAQTSTVSQQYVAMLETGSVDPDKSLPEFIDKLKKAGSDKIVAEVQKQIDAWRQTAGK